MASQAHSDWVDGEAPADNGTVSPELPAGWSLTPLATVATFSIKPPAHDRVENVPFVPMAMIPTNSLYISHWEMRKPMDVRSGVFFREGDLLVAKITPCLENGKQGIVVGTPAGWGYATTEVFPLTPIGVVGEYLAYYLMLPRIRRELAQKMEGTTGRQRLPKAVIQSLPVPCPPLSEQRAIAGVLRTVQRAKETTEAVIAATRELKRSLMRHLFTYGPVPISEAGNMAQRETDFGSVPTRWQMMPLGRCSTVQTGLAKGRKLVGTEIVELPYLRVANVQDGFLDLAEMKLIPLLKNEVSRYLLHDRDVVLTEGGDPDKLGRGFIWRRQIAECVHQNHIFAVRADLNLVTPEYLSFLVQSDYGKAYFLQVAHRTTNLASINSTKLKSFPVLVPPLHEQAEIVQRLVVVDNKLATEEQRKSALDALFTSLLEHLMTGKVRVTPDLVAASEGVV